MDIQECLLEDRVSEPLDTHVQPFQGRENGARGGRRAVEALFRFASEWVYSFWIFRGSRYRARGNQFQKHGSGAGPACRAGAQMDERKSWNGTGRGLRNGRSLAPLA